MRRRRCCCCRYLALKRPAVIHGGCAEWKTARTNYKRKAILNQLGHLKVSLADIPYKDLCFTGRASLKGASRGESFFMPTKDCLVDLSDAPFFLLDTNELEIAYFERVSHNLKYFDMVFVCKDYETWVRIDAIPTKKLENVKTWIDSINVRR